MLKLFALAAAALAGATFAEDAVGVPGGWSDGKLDAETKSVFLKALGDKKYYDDNVVTRLCVKKIKSVRQQVVAGMNYDFDVQGCDLTQGNKNQQQQATKQRGYGVCDAKLKCKAVNAHVRIFEQAWTDTLNVTEIKLY